MLPHHVTTNTGDAVYRIDVDSYSIENLVMSGIFPLMTSTAALIVMFSLMASIDASIALLSLAVVPFLFLSLRHYMKTLVHRIENVKSLESRLVEKLYEVFAAMRLVKSFAREPHELGKYRLSGDEVMKAQNLDAPLFPGGSGSAIAAKPGYPTVIVPFATVANAPTPPLPDGFEARPGPYGVSFTGMACSEPRLIELAYAFEQATRRRVPPPSAP